uniref:Uncharacterized protein n=1 Tax=Siphoviridae sp. ctK0l2 TaxID=2826243 RepID=A0A8S5NKA6_9CAUD|nr:MAG TPA: hypothetical protein [Siphoviridae sp. ctK0l2]
MNIHKRTYYRSYFFTLYSITYYLLLRYTQGR